jgi:putative ABC transport system permease protein
MRRPSRHRPQTTIGWRATIGEALAGATQRPSRTALTLAGIVVGVAAFVAVLGLTATASGQISDSFSVLRATSVTLHDAPQDASVLTANDFPADAESKVHHLNGVVAAGIAWPLPGGTIPKISTSLDPRTTSQDIDVLAASPGYLDAVGATLGQGRPFTSFDETQRENVAVLGRGAARDLGITHIWPTPTVYIRGTGYAVIGIISDAVRAPEIMSQVVIPSRVAEEDYGRPTIDRPAWMLITTDLGAAAQVAREAPLALRPDSPALLVADPVNDDLAIESHITDALRSLLWGLAAVTLFMGAVGIANTTFATVIERTHEIGLRRSLGARRRDILAQFLGECGALGLIGGLVGTAIGASVVLLVAVVNQWTALIDPLVIVSGPAVGALTSLAAGAYPAHLAGKIQPVEALRRS